MTPEAKVVRHFQRRARDVGCITRKVVYVGRRGCPDQLLIGPGKVYLCEIKAADGKLAVVQRVERERLNTAYGDAIAVVLYGNNGVDEFFDEVFRGKA